MSITVSREPTRKRQFWIDHVERWQLSGLSKANYCEQHQLKPGSFYNWASKIGATKRIKKDVKLPDRKQPVEIQFQSVKLTQVDKTTSRFVHVERAATDIALPTDLTPEQIHQWLSAIHQLHV